MGPCKGAGAAFPTRNKGNDRRYPDDDPKHCEAGAQFITVQTFKRFKKRLCKIHFLAFPSFSLPEDSSKPSCKRITRWVCSAIRGSCVTMISVVPRSLFRLSKRLMI